MDPDLIDLLSAWQSEEIDPHRREDLLERLRRDPAFQEAFLDEIHLLARIKVVQATEPRWLRLQDELGWGAGKRPAEKELEYEVMSRIDALPERRWHPALRWGVVAGAGAAAAVLVAAMVLLSWPKGPREARAPVRLTQVAEVRSSGDLAIVVKLEKVRWASESADNPSEGASLAARRLQIQSGRAALSFFSGVTLTLEGPADVDLVAIDRVFCRRGRLRARVPQGAEGFVVTSPGSAVVDMGTEFALNVEANGKSRVMVFEGSAEAALLDAAGLPTSTQVVEQSHAFELDPFTGRIAEAAAHPEGFVTRTETAVPGLILDPGYSAAVAQSRPRGYWRFERIEDGAVPNEIPGGAPLVAHGPVASARGAPREDSIIASGCAVFSAGKEPQFFTTDGLWDQPQTPGHAVELWFLPEGISHASLVGLFPPKDHLALGRHGRHVHTFLLELTAWDRRSLFKPAAIRFLHRWPLDTRIGSNLFSEETYRPRRWHHVVAQKNHDRIELYYDGQLAHSLLLEPDHPTVSGRLLVGRRSADPLELYDPRGFVGRLDELAFYDHPLTTEEVRAHYQLAAETPGRD